MQMSVRKKLLAVDDSRVALLTIKRLLSESEFDLVGEARTGQAAVQQYRDHTPDLVLLDIVMPDMDGVQVLQALINADAQAKIIMASSLGTKEKVMECIEKGAKSFLMKPYEKDDLLTVLRKVIEGV
jgi:two-component system chemotaxis response regulator CheY